MNNNYKNYVLFAAVFALAIAALGTVAVRAEPIVDVSHSPLNPTTADDVTFVATAFDTAGISEIIMFVDAESVEACPDSLCIFTASQMPEGIHYYYAEAVNGNGDTSVSDSVYFYVAAEEPGPDPEPGPECALDVAGLDVAGDIIYYSIRNTGTEDTVISYSIRINTDTIQTGSFSLDAGHANSDHRSHDFGYDTHVITLDAVSDCGASDSQTITHTVFRPYSCTSPKGYEGDYRCDYGAHRRYRCDDGYWHQVSGYYSECEDDDYYDDYYYHHYYYDNPCTSRYLDGYRCDGDVLQRKYKYSDCSTTWKDWEYCSYGCETEYYAGSLRSFCVDSYYYHYPPYHDCSAGWSCIDSDHKAYRYSDCRLGQSYYCPNGCYDGACRTSAPTPYPPPYHPPSYPASQCGVTIENLDFSHTLISGQTASVKFNSENTGRYSEPITYKLFVDSVLIDSETKTLNSGSTYFKEFQFKPSRGQHSLRIVAEAGCGFSDVRLASMFVGDEGSQPSPSQPSTAPLITSIDANPSQLDMKPFESKVFSIEINTARTQTFTIDISGMESDWLSYPSTAYVEKGTKRIYVYVSPMKDGVYPLNIDVRALSEGKDFSKVVRVYVSQPATSAASMTGAVAAQPYSASGASDRPVTGLVVAGDAPFWFAVLVIIAVIVAYLVAKEYRLRRASKTEGFAMHDLNKKSF